MFFIIGVSDKSTRLEYDQLRICDQCGKYGRDELYMTYRELRLFFVPVFKWSRSYMLRRSCCQTAYYLDEDVGRDIEEGRPGSIRKEDLRKVHTSVRTCPNCSNTVSPSFDYCPYCGERL